MSVTSLHYVTSYTLSYYLVKVAPILPILHQQVAIVISYIPQIKAMTSVSLTALMETRNNVQYMMFIYGISLMMKKFYLNNRP